MKDVFEVPKIVMSNCGVGIVAGAINVIEIGAPVARAKVYCWVYLILDDLLVVFPQHELLCINSEGVLGMRFSP